MESRVAIPAAQSDDPLQYTPPKNRTVIPLNAEREKAYIELARQYFYVFSTTPAVVPAVKRTPFSSEAIVVASEEAEPTNSKREEILDNFTACMKKISPAAQITLIQELIRSAHTNEELKLLEGLLDDVWQPADDRS
jgi:hypothetical protein